MKRHFLITIVDGFHYRYLVHTGIFDHLLDASDKLVVCGTPAVLQLLAHRTSPRLILAPLPPQKAGRMQSLHLFLRSSASGRLSETLNIKSEQQLGQSKWRWRARRLVGKLMAWTAFEPSRWVESAWFDASVETLLREHEISSIVLSTPGQKLEDLPFLEAARRHGIRTTSPVYSWDNLTAKGPFVIPPDQLVVWNEVMKREAVHYHGYSPDNVHVGGVPVFDPYVVVQAEADQLHRSKFLSRLNLDPARRLITLTTIPPVYYGRGHRQLAELIIGWITGGQLPLCSLLIRPHPMDSTDYGDLAGQNVVVDHYGSEPNADPRRWTPTDDNTLHLGRTMAFSDVVINIASTITVDAACFDTPTVNVAFDLKAGDADYVGSVERYYRYTHYQQVVSTGAAALARSPQEMLSAICAYLAQRSRDSEGRRLLVRNQVGALDGKAWQRTAQAILQVSGAQ